MKSFPTKGSVRNLTRFTQTKFQFQDAVNRYNEIAYIKKKRGGCLCGWRQRAQQDNQSTRPREKS